MTTRRLPANEAGDVARPFFTGALIVGRDLLEI
jgi:hypothetical protein